MPLLINYVQVKSLKSTCEDMLSLVLQSIIVHLLQSAYDDYLSKLFYGTLYYNQIQKCNKIEINKVQHAKVHNMEKLNKEQIQLTQLTKHHTNFTDLRVLRLLKTESTPNRSSSELSSDRTRTLR